MAETQKDVHPDTVRRVLELKGFNGQVAERKPYMCRNRIEKKWLGFVQEYIVKPKKFWEDVVIADENKFNFVAQRGDKWYGKSIIKN